MASKIQVESIQEKLPVGCEVVAMSSWHGMKLPGIVIEHRNTMLLVKFSDGSIEAYRYLTIYPNEWNSSLVRPRDNSDLTEQLKGLEGYRVEVITDYDEKRRFIVGKSTGWKPAHLEIARRNCYGGGLAEKHYKSVRTLYKVW